MICLDASMTIHQMTLRSAFVCHVFSNLFVGLVALLSTTSPFSSSVFFPEMKRYINELYLS
jgi:hypothetical protein